LLRSSSYPSSVGASSFYASQLKEAASSKHKNGDKKDACYYEREDFSRFSEFYSANLYKSRVGLHSST